MNTRARALKRRRKKREEAGVVYLAVFCWLFSWAESAQRKEKAWVFTVSLTWLLPARSLPLDLFLRVSPVSNVLQTSSRKSRGKTQKTCDPVETSSHGNIIPQIPLERQKTCGFTTNSVGLIPWFYKTTNEMAFNCVGSFFWFSRNCCTAATAYVYILVLFKEKNKQEILSVGFIWSNTEPTDLVGKTDRRFTDKCGSKSVKRICQPTVSVR